MIKNLLRNLMVLFLAVGALHGCMDELPDDQAKPEQPEQAEDAAQAGEQVEERGDGLCCFGGTWT